MPRDLLQGRKESIFKIDVSLPRLSYNPFRFVYTLRDSYIQYNNSIPYHKYPELPHYCVWTIYLCFYVTKTYFKIVKKIITNI